MPERSAKVMRSPRLAAMGVATLSGLIPIFRDPMITPIMIIPSERQATWGEEEKRRPNQQKIAPRCRAESTPWEQHPHPCAFFPFLPSTKEAMKAVATLLAHNRKACGILKWPSGIQPKTTAAMDARKPTTVACTWGETWSRGEPGAEFLG